MYQILFDWGTEGFKFEGGEFGSVEAAVKHALGLNYNTKFLIVKVIDWEANEIKKT